MREEAVLMRVRMRRKGKDGVPGNSKERREVDGKGLKWEMWEERKGGGKGRVRGCKGWV